MNNMKAIKAQQAR